MLFDNRYFQNTQERPKDGTKPFQDNATDHPAGKAPEQAPPEDFQRMKEWLRSIQADADHARSVAEDTRQQQHELQASIKSLSQKSNRTGLFNFLLIAALAAAGFYGYKQVQQQFLPLGQIPGLQQMVNAVGERVGVAEASLQQWSEKWSGLGERVARTERTAAANLKAGQEFAAAQVARVQQSLQQDIVSRSQAADASLSELRAAQQQDRAATASLQLEVTGLKQNSEQQLAELRQDVERRDSDLSSQMAESRRNLGEVQNQLARRRVNFELNEDQTLEVIPGVSVTVSKTDVRMQRVEGRIHLIQDGRIVWVRGHGIQQPATFYTLGDSRPYQIVFTRVTQGSAVGYVLMPVERS